MGIVFNMVNKMIDKIVLEVLILQKGYSTLKECIVLLKVGEGYGAAIFVLKDHSDFLACSESGDRDSWCKVFTEFVIDGLLGRKNQKTIFESRRSNDWHGEESFIGSKKGDIQQQRGTT